MRLMKILFCGTMVSEKIEYQMRNISAAGNRFQNNMIAHLEKAGHEVAFCSFLGMDIPDKVKGQLSGNYVFKDGGLLKGILDYYRLLRKTMDDVDMVICYNIVYAWLALPLMIQRRQKRGVAIIADYSESVSYRSIGRKLYAKLQLWSMRRFEIVVGLSENIEGTLRRRQKFILMEGAIDEELYNAFAYKPHEEGTPITFMYSGLLNHVAGVNILLEAMKRVERQDVRIWVSGKGELEREVKTAASEDGRIDYLGHLPYEEYVQRLQEADVLVNPRDMRLPENKNNFPSKIMDYLAAGKPIISTKFAGWERFEGNIVFCGDGAWELGKCLEGAEECLEDAEEVYDRNRDRARSFRWDGQVKRIL